MRPGWWSAAGLALASAVVMAGGQSVFGQAGAFDPQRTIPSLLEPGQGLTVRERSTATGFVSFAMSPGNGLLLPMAADEPALDRALAFVDAYGASFGLRDRSRARLLRTAERDTLGLDHVRLQQMHLGVPVRGGELVVHLRGARVVGANGQTIDRLPAHVQAAYPAGAASMEARAVVERSRPVAASAPLRLTAPRLEIFAPRVFGRGNGPARLAWFVEASGPLVREWIWIDATTGGVLLNFSQLAHAKTRAVHDANGTAALPGTMVRSEGQAATGIVDADLAYDLTGAAYDYFFGAHGRDSFDGQGGALISSIGYCSPSACPYGNAFWNGTQMIFGAGFASADDVVAHELTHAITERTADLFYYYQSGALSESYSDIFGEIVDLTSAASGGNDTPAVRWRIGEDLPVGAVRDMMTPALFGDPGRMSDAEMLCPVDAWTNSFSDRGGVHTNSGIPNHAFALMTDGGAYNGETIAGIGLAKAGRIHYRALTTYLVSGSTFRDHHLAVTQACADLIGVDGLTQADCTQVGSALRAVEMSATWNCPGAVAPAEASCSNGAPLATVFADDMETDNGQWSLSSGSAMPWMYISSMFSTSGARSLYGIGLASTSDHAASMTTPVVVPASARLHFAHAFEFDSWGGSDWDGGVIEYSVGSSDVWSDAGFMIEAGQPYNGFLGTDNPLGARAAFARTSYGFTTSRLNLTMLAGQSVRFRFRVGTDETLGSLGWFVDDVRIYECAADIVPAFTTNPQPQTVQSGQPAQFHVAVTGSPAPTLQWQMFVNGGSSWINVDNGGAFSGATSTTLTIAPATTALGGRSFRALAANTAGSVASQPAALTVVPAPVARRGFDFDGDGRTDRSIFRPANGQWWIHQSGLSLVTAATFGLDGDVIVPRDYTGDGKTDVAVYRPASGTWLVLRSEGGGTDSWTLGAAGDVPVPADYDGDGRADVAVFRPATGTWFIRRSSDGTMVVQAFGSSGDVPAVGDYDGDLRADIAIYRPVSGQWWILQSTLGLRAVAFGMSGDLAVPEDYTGDGRTDIAVWRPSTGTWFVLRSEGTGFFGAAFGSTNDIPVPGDYDGDGRADLAVFRPSGGTWFVEQTTAGLSITTFGLGTDKPVPSAFVASSGGRSIGGVRVQ